MALSKVGDVVTWTSQAQGSHVEKKGTVLGIIESNADARKRPELENVPQSRIKFQSISTKQRYLIAVARGGKSQLIDYYAPLSSNIDKQVAAARGHF